MPRELVSPQEIQHWLSERINQNRLLLDDGHHQNISAPMKNEPDAEGCNWSISVWRSPRGYEAVIRAALLEAMSKFNLE